ncbi:MAG: cyclic nucleotide-binding domain-containing protein [Burkholderiaceae bacterium]|jgi:CRP-like cAMP-binding protein/Fe-S-cluster-containing hydrogenase component 2/thioredoxin reductase
MSASYKIVIIGSGPSGLSAAGHAAELGVPHILLEASPHPADTIYKYQKGKHVMAEPNVLPLRSPMSFVAGTRESILEKWDRELAQLKVNIRYSAEVVGVTGQKGAFQVALANGERIACEHVVLAIGLQGNLRKIGVANDDHPQVQYQLDDPEAYEDETIVVIGAGDAAIENALALSTQNRVILVNRNEEFTRCKEGNLNLVLAAIDDGRLECRYGTRAEAIDLVRSAEGDLKPLRFVCRTPKGVDGIACDRIIARLGATPPRKLVEGFGVKFPNKDAAAVPQLSEYYESNVPGLYIVGALGGYPLIKQAMNQGYEVVESILGRPVEPADEPLLKAKFRPYRRAQTVAQGLALLRENIPMFAGLTTLQLREFMLDSEVLAPRPGDIVFERNDYTNSFFSVIEGEVIVHAVSGSDPEKLIRLGAGEFFGEMGLISGRRRSARVTAGQGCLLLETPRRSMLKLIASVESVSRRLDEVSLKRHVQTYLADSIPENEVDYLVRGAVIKSYAAGETLFREGDAADGLYLVRRGSVTVSREFGGREVVIAYQAAGSFVGEMALTAHAPRSATIRAAVYTEVVLLEAQRVTEVMARNTAIRGKIEASYYDRIRSNASAASSADSGSLISFLVKQGVGEATDVLLIDQSLCIRCDNCEKACADTHDGTSRLDREAGPSYAEIHVPTSCRHCEHPHCMKDCPPDAIRRSASGEVFIEDTCIGCGNCQQNCPYGVIQLAPVNKKRHRPSLLTWLLLGLGPEPGVEPKYKGKDRAKKAVKCDMCQNLSSGPACVSACPTGAAMRVSPERFMRYADADE